MVPCVCLRRNFAFKVRKKQYNMFWNPRSLFRMTTAASVVTGSVGKRLELTQCIIKPCACANPHTLAGIRDVILENGFYVLKSRHLSLSREDSERFYSIHRDKFFYNRLVTYMSSGPVYAHLLAREDAITKWRTLMGPTKTYRARYEAPASIRGRFGLTDTRNATHGSDSTESARLEIQFFFPDFDYERWYAVEECDFRHNRNIVFDPVSFEHRPKRTKNCRDKQT